MAVGFRKSLFGFNCDDVVAYVEKAQKAFTEKEIVLNEQIEDLRGENSDIKEQLAKITIEKAAVEAKLKEFTDKYDEIERLSQNIGKLYLVAEANAKSIMKEATECADISRREVQKNMSSIDNAHLSLSNMKEDLIITTSTLTKDIEGLAKSLSEAREKIIMRESAAIKDEEDYRDLIKALSNG